MKGIFIDFDGTLADSLPNLREAYFSFLDGLGFKGTESEFQSLNGPPLPEIISRLQSSYQLRDDAEKLATQYAALVKIAHASANPAPGARALLSRAKHQNWKIAVVTSSPHQTTRTWLKRKGLADCIDVLVGGDEVANGKPNREPYVLALTKTGCVATNSIAIEDSRLGARSAVDAGLETYAISDTRGDGWPEGVKFIRGLSDLIDTL